MKFQEGSANYRKDMMQQFSKIEKDEIRVVDTQMNCVFVYF